MEIDVLTFLVMSLATWRLSKLITEEEGPFMVFTRLRASFPADGWIGRGLYCFWCVSFWVGLVVGLATTPVPAGIVYGLAFSTLAIICDLVIESILQWARRK